MLERHCISFLLGEIKYYPNRVRETNIVILVDFTSQVEEVFQCEKISMSLFYLTLFSFICLLLPQVSISYLHQRIINFDFANTGIRAWFLIQDGTGPTCWPRQFQLRN